MKNSWKVAGLVAGALAIIGAGAAVAHGRGGPGFMKAAMEKRLAEAEDFVAATPEQRKVIEGSRDAIEAKMKARFEARRAEFEKSKGAPPADPHDLVRMLASDKIDEQVLYAEIDRRAEEMKAMAREIVPEVIKAHDALTPEQRQKLAARAEKMRSERRGAGGHHGWHGGPGGAGPQGGFGGPDEQ